MNKEELIKDIIECNSLNKNCDFLLEHSDCDILTEMFEESKQLKDRFEHIVVNLYRESEERAKLQERINDAIKYIKSNDGEPGFTGSTITLLKILKGEGKRMTVYGLDNRDLFPTKIGEYMKKHEEEMSWEEYLKFQGDSND